LRGSRHGDIMEQIKTIGKRMRHLIDKEWCKGCGICIRFCPEKVLEFDSQAKAEAARPEDCIGCKLCEFRCPDLAIQVIEAELEDKNV
jgi:2-oxoglutarate ferredoxin oxidoreductase subunit delta